MEITKLATFIIILKSVGTLCMNEKLGELKAIYTAARLNSGVTKTKT